MRTSAAATFVACRLIVYLTALAASQLYWTRYFYDIRPVYPAQIGNQSIYGVAIRIFDGAAPGKR